MKNADRWGIVLPYRAPALLLHCDDGDGFGLKTMQDLVEGYIETAPAAPTAEGLQTVLIVNEEGKLRGLPINEPATRLCAVPDLIVGNALLMAVKGDRLIGLKQKEAERILQALCESAGEPGRTNQ